MKKSMWLFALAAVMVFSLCACGDKDEPSPGSGESEEYAAGQSNPLSVTVYDDITADFLIQNAKIELGSGGSCSVEFGNYSVCLYDNGGDEFQCSVYETQGEDASFLSSGTYYFMEDALVFNVNMSGAADFQFSSVDTYTLALDPTGAGYTPIEFAAADVVTDYSQEGSASEQNDSDVMAQYTAYFGDYVYRPDKTTHHVIEIGENGCLFNGEQYVLSSVEWEDNQICVEKNSIVYTIDLEQDCVYSNLDNDDGVFNCYTYTEDVNEAWWIRDAYVGTYTAEDAQYGEFYQDYPSTLVINEDGSLTYEINGLVYTGQLPEQFNGEILAVLSVLENGTVTAEMQICHGAGSDYTEDPDRIDLYISGSAIIHTPGLKRVS